LLALAAIRAFRSASNCGGRAGSIRRRLRVREAIAPIVQCVLPLPPDCCRMFMVPHSERLYEPRNPRLLLLSCPLFEWALLLSDFIKPGEDGRLPVRVHDPLGHCSRLQRIYPHMWCLRSNAHYGGAAMNCNELRVCRESLALPMLYR
jgi:hypothetical protein